MNSKICVEGWGRSGASVQRGRGLRLAEALVIGQACTWCGRDVKIVPDMDGWSVWVVE